MKRSARVTCERLAFAFYRDLRRLAIDMRSCFTTLKYRRLVCGTIDLRPRTCTDTCDRARKGLSCRVSRDSLPLPRKKRGSYFCGLANARGVVVEATRSFQKRRNVLRSTQFREIVRDKLADYSRIEGNAPEFSSPDYVPSSRCTT